MIKLFIKKDSMQSSNNPPEIINQEHPTKRYMKSKLLGKGGFAKCFEYIDEKTKESWAVKIISKSSLTKPRHHLKLQSEINIQKSMNHPNVVKFHNYIEDSENHYIVMELCPNQTLKDILRRRKKFTEMEARYYLSQLINGIKHIHSKNVIHRDLKLGNLYLSSNLQLKIGDFGLSAQLIDQFGRRQTICGTPNYIAPEVLEQKNGHSFEADIWPIGVILYCMLIGRPPFESSNVKQTYRKIRSNLYQFPDSVEISDSAKTLIMKILVLDPKKRPSLDKILEEDFMISGPIPPSLPISSLATPPNESMLTSYMLGSTCTKENLKGLNSKLEKSNSSPNTNKVLSSLALTSRITSCRPNTALLNLKDNFQVKPKETIDVLNKSPNFESARSKAISTLSSISKLQFIYINNWTDMTEKYGVGYELTNGNIGFYFNDQTSILLIPSTNLIVYTDLSKGKDKKTNDFVKEKFNLEIYPEYLTKKIKILNFFLNNIKKENNKERIGDASSEDFVKSLAKTKHGILFRLTNSITQMGFIDNSAIALNYKQKKIVYNSKYKELKIYSIESNLYSIADNHAVKRIKYTLNLINQLLGKN